MRLALAAALVSLVSGAAAWWLAAWAADRASNVVVPQIAAALSAVAAGSWARRHLRSAAGWEARLGRGVAALGALVGLVWLGAVTLLYLVWPK